jgi:hypothetical protein
MAPRSAHAPIAGLERFSDRLLVDIGITPSEVSDDHPRHQLPAQDLRVGYRLFSPLSSLAGLPSTGNSGRTDTLRALSGTDASRGRMYRVGPIQTLPTLLRLLIGLGFAAAITVALVRTPGAQTPQGAPETQLDRSAGYFAQSLQDWDPGTHTTKQYWSRPCLAGECGNSQHTQPK